MSIQDDNTLATKGDLKNLYTNKIAPYLGGGINYYQCDRSGQELKSGQFALALSTSHGTGTDATINANAIVPFIMQSGNFELGVTTGTFKVPNGMRIEVDVYATVTNGASTNCHWYLYNATDSKEIDIDNGTNLPGAYLYGGQASNYGMSQSATYQWTNNTGKTVEVGIRNMQSSCIVRVDSTGMTVKEIGRIVDPVKYVSNNSDLQETPVGNIISYMGNSVPKHYLACDGTIYNIGSYPELETFIINEFGSINYFGGDGTTNWAVPDLRGEFLRGSGTNSHENQGNGANVGEHQDGTIQNSVSSNGSNAYLIGDYISNTRPNNIKADWTSDTGTVYYGSANKVAQNTSFGFTSRPTNTSVKYCIKYESTYHAFFSNAAYKVSVAASVTSSSGAQVVFDSSDIIGDSSLVSDNSLVTPMDGWYSLGMNWTQAGSGDVGYYIRVNGNNAGYNRGILVNNTLYLQKGDVVTINKESGTNNSGRVNFCLLTSNYNPTIVSADSVYSEHEQMIGYWKDGKPLYQRTLVYNNRVLGADINTDLNKNTINIIDYDFVHYANSTPTGDVVNKGGCHPQGASTWASWLYFVKSSDSNYWKVASRVGSSLGVSTCSFTITVRYTKTTDAASSLKIENSLLLNRPDLWEVGTEYSFGGGLYGQRFTGNLAALAKGGNRTSVQLSPANTFTNRRIFDFGGCVTAYNSNVATCVHPIGSKSINNSQDSSATGYHMHSGIYITGDGRLQLGYQAGDHYTTTANTYDVWVTYKK